MLTDQADDLDDDETPSNCRRLDFDDYLDDEDKYTEDSDGEPDADSDNDLSEGEMHLATGLFLSLVAVMRLRRSTQLSPWRLDWRSRLTLGDKWLSRW